MPYYSVKSIPKKKKSKKKVIYHRCRNCSVGDNINKRNLRGGTPKRNAVLCKTCAKLLRNKICDFGIPVDKH
jgi:hypothetical protein